jgi:AraC-like DNA-binding protein
METELDRGDGTGTSGASVLTVLDGMAAVGIDIGAVCAASGVTYEGLETREALISPPQLGVIWREATRLYGRGTVGMAVAMAAPTGRLVVDYVASTSATLYLAVQQMARYHRLITRNGDLHLRKEGELTVLDLLLNLPPAAIPSQIIEYSITTMARRVFDFSGKRVRGVQFAHAPLGPREDYLRLLGVAPRFEADTAGLTLDDDLLGTPCRGNDPGLFKLVRAHAELLLERLPRDATMRAQARRAVVGAIAQGEPEVAAVARTLATSDRSLQRRLQEEGTSFREVVDDARRELAVGYLGDRRMTVAEVAYLLGYSEASAFVRAFKRWTGKTPGEMRAVAVM